MDAHSKKLLMFLISTLLLILIITPSAAQEGTNSVPWTYTSVDHYTPTCVPNSGASLEIADNSLTYTFAPSEEPSNLWQIRFTWETPVMGGTTPSLITGRIDGTVIREGSASGPTPGVRMFMITVPSAYTIKSANVEFSGSLGAGGSVGDNFEANANPDWTEPFDVLVWFSAFLCDLGSREVARYHFQRTTALPASGQPAPQATVEVTTEVTPEVSEVERQEICRLVYDTLQDLEAKREQISTLLEDFQREESYEQLADVIDELQLADLDPDMQLLIQLAARGNPETLIAYYEAFLQAILNKNQDDKILAQTIGIAFNCPDGIGPTP
jgi:hypothetical protein